MMQRIVDRQGEFVKVTQTHTGRAWMVQRHYIALHGLKEEDLPKLGFKEVHQ